MGRLFELALALGTLDGGGILLVDEIDTGLHHRVLESLWRFVAEEARRRDLQVMATTHSLDCLRALAAFTSKTEAAGNEVGVHRVERGASTTTFFSSEELETVVEQEVEIR